MSRPKKIARLKQKTVERKLQRELRANIERLEVGLKIIDGGKERRINFDGGEDPNEWGQIDITAKDKKGWTVVIELKAGRAGRRAIGQILGYMGVLMKSVKSIRGILVAKEFSPKGIAAARAVPKLKLIKHSDLHFK
jgi:RecB family endonuclease NucS